LASVALLVATSLAAAPANATRDPLLEGARLCTQYFPVEERTNSIPTHLLAAIATTESGRYHKGLGMSVPWPWTINVEGKGYHFNSKAEAIAQTQRFLAAGRASIDVGCMQVNLKHHPKAFSDLNQAFDPERNVAYASKFLRENHASMGDWIKATAAYHSRTAVHGNRYLGEIERNWNRIVGKVAQARGGKAGEMPVEKQSQKASVEKPRTPRVINVSNAQTMAPAKRVRVIKVSDVVDRRHSEVMVVRATPSSYSESVEPVVQASAPQGSSIRRVSLDSPATTNVAVSPAGSPNFVFAN
jgi:hypothetical protein